MSQKKLVLSFIHLINQAVGRADIRHFQTDLIHIHTVCFFFNPHQGVVFTSLGRSSSSG